TAAMKSSRWSTMQVSFHGTGGLLTAKPAARQTCSPLTQNLPNGQGRTRSLTTRKDPVCTARGRRITTKG
ncbi:MAG: hypothetical protein ACLQBL_16365, partial [Polyangiaceae bacterium]